VLNTFEDRINQVRSCGEDVVGKINECIIALDRILIPTAYTVYGSFDHDPAAWQPPILPTLNRLVMKLMKNLNKNTNEYRFTLTKLIRERNRILSELIKAYNLATKCANMLGCF